MKNKCSVVQDLLPLFEEKMVQKETALFIEEHLSGCSECNQIRKSIKDGNVLRFPIDEASQGLIKSLHNVRKKIIRRIIVTVLVIFISIASIYGILQVFPVYRIFQDEWDNSFTISERKMLGYIGSAQDRKIAQSVINQAEIAFSDTTHIYEENMQLYGELGRYAFDSYYFGEFFDAVAEKHTIDLLSAHIDGNNGYIFVEYSQEAIDINGESVSGSWGIRSLWEIEKNEQGNWVVVNIKEHP